MNIFQVDNPGNIWKYICIVALKSKKRKKKRGIKKEINQQRVEGSTLVKDDKGYNKLVPKVTTDFAKEAIFLALCPATFVHCICTLKKIFLSSWRGCALLFVACVACILSDFVHLLLLSVRSKSDII